MPTIPDPYEHTVFRGRPLDYATAAASVAAEVELGYRLTVIQGIGGASASGGTHLLGRCTDLAPYDGDRKERVHRDLGFVSYHRPAIPDLWGEHVHSALILESRGNEKGIAPAGFRQIALYDAGRDALKDNLLDPHPYRPSPPRVFTLDQYRHVMTEHGLNGGPLPTRVTKIRDALVQEDYDLGLIVALLKGLPDGDPSLAEVDNLQKDRKRIRAMLERMPKR